MRCISFTFDPLDMQTSVSFGRAAVALTIIVIISILELPPNMELNDLRKKHSFEKRLKFLLEKISL